MDCTLTSPINQFIDRLDARRSGNGWSACCPAHEDRRSSLSIGVGDDGRVLLHCFAGCTIEAILSKLGLTKRDLMGTDRNTPGKNGHAKRRAKKEKKPKEKEKKPTYAWPSILAKTILGLRKEHGNPVECKQRWNYEDGLTVVRFDLPTPAGEKQIKTFRQFTRLTLPNGGEEFSFGGPTPPHPLYRQKELLAADPSVAFVCAGEKAVDAALAFKIVVTTNAGGEKAIDKTDWGALARFAKVIVVIDNDKTGEAFGKAVVAKLKALNPKQIIKIIRLPGLPEKGDVVEFIAAGGTREQFLQIVEETPAVTDQEVEEWTDADNGDGDGGEEPGFIKIVADQICERDQFAQDGGGTLYRYVGGVFRGRADRYIKAEVKRILVESDSTKKWSSRFASEVVEYIRVDAPTLPENPSVDLVNVQNGMVRVSDGVLLEHSPDYLSAVQLPVTYDPAATCPLIDKAIADWFPTDAVPLAYEVFGWLMTADTSIQKAVLLLGDGGNGKSRFLALVVNFLGKPNVSSVSLHKLEANKFATARLVGKLANVCPDLPSEHLAGTSVFKALTGGDPLDCEQKFRDGFDLVPFARLVFSANHPPRSGDASHAFFRRWQVIPFDREFSPAERIPPTVLDARLSAPEELSGLLNRSLAALREIRQRGDFSEPESVRRAWEAFHAETDPLAVWLERNTIEQPDALVPKSVLRSAYNQDAEAAGRPTLTTTSWGRALGKLRPNVQDAQRTVNGKLQWCYVGIGLSGGPDDDSLSSRSSRSSPHLISRTENEGGGMVGSDGGDDVGVKQEGPNRVNCVNPVNGTAGRRTAQNVWLPLSKG